MKKIKAFLKKKDVVFTLQRYGIDALGVIVSAIIGIASTLPISSAAICAAFGLTGLAGGAADAQYCEES